MSSDGPGFPAVLIGADSEAHMSHEPREEGSPSNIAQPCRPFDDHNHVDSSHLSPFYTSQPHHSSTSASPVANSSNTPADSIATSVDYLSSALSDVDEDPFLGADFGNPGVGTPSFLDDPYLGFTHSDDQDREVAAGPASPTAFYTGDVGVQQPISPDRTPSLRGVSPQASHLHIASIPISSDQNSISPAVLSRKPDPSARPLGNSEAAAQLTPEASGSNRSSEDGLAQAEMPLPSHSPRVTVSFWDRGDVPPTNTTQLHDPQTQASQPSPDNAHNTHAPAYSRETLQAWDEQGQRMPDPATGSRGLDPTARPSTEIDSVNDLAAHRDQEERNREVDDWLSRSDTLPPNPDAPAMPPRIDTTRVNGEDDGIPPEEIALGDETENKPIPGQTYFVDGGGHMTQQDYDIIQQNRNWADAPVLFPISRESDGRHQPETSQQAIERFERMCRDNDSIVSRAATWGTRRRSLPSISDIEGVTSGNFLKKLSLSKGDTRRSSILREIRGLVRNPSSGVQLLKRGRSNQEDESEQLADGKGDARGSQQNQTLLSRTQSGKKSTRSINNALVSMGSNAASIGAGHARRVSVSATVTSPKSALGGLAVKNTLRRRSNSEAPEGHPTVGTTSHPNLVGMWKRTGGPPVPSLAQPGAALPDAEDDDDEEEELYDNEEAKQEAGAAIDDITPNFAGFKEHLLRLCPLLANDNTFLVDRIAHQQTIRYKARLNVKLKHLQQVAGRQCPCGPLCIAMGGSAVALDTKKDDSQTGGDLLSAHLDGSDGDITPMEGAVNQDRFPADIPMPPTSTLPARFECQLCYQIKKFQKPSDWTKHVHEDVLPFTCTWERCREPKMFKRKADWVRHENEGHRQLEWWECDIEDCHHKCYRRDNFLQHLVREHKFPEPKVKTKAQIKRNPQLDATWQKVENCHFETNKRPQEEPCPFCRKSFPTWKKLTVHLAKHMEQISLPVLRLVARKQLDPDTIISPVQDPPPRAVVPLSAVKTEPPSFHSTPNLGHHTQFPPQSTQFTYADPQQQPGSFGYPMATGFPPAYYDAQNFDPLPPQNVMHPHHGMVPPVTDAFSQVNSMPAHTDMPFGSTGYATGPTQFVSAPPGLEPFPPVPMNPLGLYGQPVPVDGMVVNPPVSASGSDYYTPQGSVSPFNRSPHQGTGGFYPQQ